MKIYRILIAAINVLISVIVLIAATNNIDINITINGLIVVIRVMSIVIPFLFKFFI